MFTALRANRIGVRSRFAVSQAQRLNVTNQADFVCALARTDNTVLFNKMRL
jgi:hypothetical protein